MKLFLPSDTLFYELVDAGAAPIDPLAERRAQIARDLAAMGIAVPLDVQPTVNVQLPSAQPTEIQGPPQAEPQAPPQAPGLSAQAYAFPTGQLPTFVWRPPDEEPPATIPEQRRIARERAAAPPARQVPIGNLENELAILPEEQAGGSPNVVQLTDGSIGLQSPQGVIPLRVRGDVWRAAAQGLLTREQANTLTLQLPENLPDAPAAGGQPPGMLTSTLETQIHAQPSAQALANAQGANEAVQQAQGLVDANQLAASQMSANARGIAAGQQQAQADEAARQEAARNQELQRRVGRLDQMMQDVAARRIDPEGFFGGPTGFANRLGATLAVALGTLGSSLTGQPNQALGIINAAIERNVAAQRDNLEHARSSVNTQQNALSQLRGIFQDQSAAEAGLRALHYGATVSRLNALMAQAQPEQLAAMQQLRDALMQAGVAQRELAAQRDAATLTIRSQVRQPMSAAGQQQMADRLLSGPPMPEQVDPVERQLTAMFGPAQEAVRRERRSTRAREQGLPPPRGERVRPEDLAPPPLEGMSLQDVQAANEIAGRAERAEGSPSRFAYLRFGGSPADQEAIARAQGSAERMGQLEAFNQAVGSFTQAAREFLRVRRLVGPEWRRSRERGQMEAALANLRNAVRQRSGMGMLNSTGELAIIEARYPAAASDGSLRFDDISDTTLNNIAGDIEGTHDAMEADARSFGYRLATVRSQAQRQRAGEEQANRSLREQNIRGQYAGRPSEAGVRVPEAVLRNERF